MEQVILYKGTKDERVYNLEMDFNTIADSDAMEQFVESMRVVNEMRPKTDTKVVPMDHQKKRRKPTDEEVVANAEESIEQMTTFMPAMKKLFVSTRAILHACLQLHHSDEFVTVTDTGRLINEMLKAKDANGKNEWDIMAVFTLAQTVLQNADSLASLMGAE